MLVLSRKTDESIVFPSLGVTVKVLRLDGAKAKLGVSAPPDIRILREEVSQRLDVSPTESAHQLRNRLNTASLSLMLYQQQIAAGQLDAANETFLRMVDDLEQVDAEAAGARNVRGSGAFDILLVEDDNRQRDLMSQYLSNRGCRVQTAADMNQAAACFETSRSPDFVLLDLNLPGSDCAQTLRRMRPYSQDHPSRFFALTGSDPDTLAIRNSDRDFIDHWFAKPTNPERVLHRMRQSQTA